MSEVIIPLHWRVELICFMKMLTQYIKNDFKNYIFKQALLKKAKKQEGIAGVVM